MPPTLENSLWREEETQEMSHQESTHAAFGGRRFADLRKVSWPIVFLSLDREARSARQSNKQKAHRRTWTARRRGDEGK